MPAPVTPASATTSAGTRTESARLDRYRLMQRIRSFENAAATLYADGEIPGFVHLSVGQEAVAVGVCSALTDRDVITSTHRGHGHVLAKGVDMSGMMAELMGRATGTCGGFGGSMHIADPAVGVFGANGIVGAGLPIAGGAAFAIRLRDENRVVASFFGDGAVATGAWHEAANLISLWNLPVVLVCENNGVSEFSRTEDQHPVGFEDRARGYGLRHVRINGNDVEEVARVTRGLVEELRAGGAPVLLEAVTHRVRGHYEGDQQRYREQAVVTDPIETARRELVAAGVAPAHLDVLDAEVACEVDDAIEKARRAPWPQPDRMHELGDVRRVVERAPAATEDLGEGLISGARCVRKALGDALAADPRVFLAGIDVGGGNVFGATRGLAELHPGRVLDTPISESAIIGLAVGAAMDGLRPVVELMYLDFVGVCLDQLMNQAAKLPFMTGGSTEIGMVLRTQFGIGRSSGSQHSQSLEALLAHIPGLVVVMPATPEDMYGMLRSAIELPAPVVVIENRLLYERKGRTPGPDHRTPLGKARVVRPGRDITVVTLSRALHTALEAAETVAAEGLECEIVDLRTVSPLDHETVLASLARTSRLLVVTEAVGDFGVGAEIAARAVDAGFWTLDAPVRRLSGPPTPVPYSPALERLWLPSVEDVVTEIRGLCHDAL
jgi:2-oxoisovalerate dehydrogenase E1 component